MIGLLISIMFIIALGVTITGGNHVGGYEQRFINHIKEYYPENISYVYNSSGKNEKDSLEYFVLMPGNELYLVTVYKTGLKQYTHKEIYVSEDDTYLRNMFETSMGNKR